MSQHDRRKHAHCAGASDFLQQSFEQTRNELLEQLGHDAAGQLNLDDAVLVERMAKAALLENEADVVSAAREIRDPAARARAILGAIEAVEDARSTGDATLIQTMSALLVFRRALEFGKLNSLPRQPESSAGKRVAIVYVAEDDPHTLGAFAVTDRMSAAGLDVRPMVHASKERLFEMLAAHPIDLLAISVGHDQILEGLADFIAETRIVSTNRALSVIVGGAVFDQSKESYAFLGADVVMVTTDNTSAEAFKNLVTGQLT